MSDKTYRNVTIDQIKNVLRADNGWNVVISDGYTKEFVFEFPLTTSPHIVIRVCSGILANGQSRGRGKDAIRVFALDTKNKCGYIKTKRVYRIGTWEKNLKKAVTNCFNDAKNRRDR